MCDIANFFHKYVNLFWLIFFSVREDTLIDMVGSMKENVGLVHQMPFVCDRKGFAAVLEKVRLTQTFGLCIDVHFQ